MSDIGLYAELHLVLFITFDKDLYHMLALPHYCNLSGAGSYRPFGIAGFRYCAGWFN